MTSVSAELSPLPEKTLTSTSTLSRSLLATAAIALVGSFAGGLPPAADPAERADAASKQVTKPSGADVRSHSIRTRSKRVRKQVQPKVPAKGWVAQPSLEAATLAGINRVRKANGLRPVKASKILKRPARAHARFLAVKRKGVLQHTDAHGRPFYYRLVRAGWRKNARMSENLASITACRAKDPAILLKRWMASPTHRVNILDPKVTHVGVGVVSSAKCRSTVYTTDFGN